MKQSLKKRAIKKITVLAGLSRTERRFPFVSIAPGLVAHQPPDCNKKSGLLNISHQESGLAVIQYVPHVRLPEVIILLSKTRWDKDIYVIYNSQNHFDLVKEAILLTSKERSERQEKRIARDLNGKRQPASGARWGYRRDVITPDFLVESKTTQSNAYRVINKDINFLKRQAYKQGKIPAYIVEILNCSEVVILPEQDIGEEALTELTEVQSPKSSGKAFSVTAELVSFLTPAAFAQVALNSGVYIILNYEKFLDFAKGE